MQNLIPSDCRVFFTSPLSRYDLSTHPLVLEADIVHLHWVSDFIDYPSFFPNINKPIVWTLHDENLAYGGFHYGRERELYYPFYAEVEDAYCAIKRSSLEKCKSISFVVLSRMMKDFYSSQPFLTGRGFCIIHNGIDPSTFRVLDKSIGRKVFRIPMDNQVIVFCSLFLNDKRKGLKELVDAIEQLNRQDISLLCIGEGRFEGETSVDIRYSGPMTSGDLMAMTYSCGDVFAFPSFQEAFAQTPLEAISCGLPIVAFPCSGMEELVHEQNGVVCDDFTAGALFEGLNKVLSRSYNRQRLHDEISRRFNADTIAGEYCHLYNSLV
jgi:glycosyltransferase involved in cell wall biosynthesis